MHTLTPVPVEIHSHLVYAVDQRSLTSAKIERTMMPSLLDGNDREAALDRLLDREEIRDLLGTYARGINRADSELTASIYHPDAYVDHGSFQGLGTDYARLPRGGDAWPMSNHTFGQSTIDIDGDVAHAESYCIFHYQKVNEELGRMRAGLMLIRYLDRLERRNDGPWKIAFRRIVLDYSHEHDVLDTWPDAGITTQGLRTDEDPVYHPESLVPRQPLV